MIYNELCAYIFPCIGWNPINLIEGEGRWVAYVATNCVIASFLTTLLYIIKNRIHAKKPSLYIQIGIEAVYTPLLFLIWYLTTIYAIDAISDELISDVFSASYPVLAKIGIVFTIAWILTSYRFLANIMRHFDCTETTASNRRRSSSARLVNISRYQRWIFFADRMRCRIIHAG